MENKIDVLDKGFVRLVDSFGDDARIVQAARISYGEGTKTISDDRSLIRYLMRHAHTSPFEMVEFLFHIRIPMDAWRQMIRHRTANVNEYSTRYSEAIDDKQQTEDCKWRSQSKNNKQGSGDYLDLEVGEQLSLEELALHNHAADVYRNRLTMGVAREQARKDLPLSTYTEAYWKIDLHNLFHFLKLRLDPHAQLEIRQYAEAIYELIKPIVPLACEAFEDYKLDAVTFSAQEFDLLVGELIGRMYSNQSLEETIDKEIELRKDFKPPFLSKREIEEFKKKLGL